MAYHESTNVTANLNSNTPFGASDVLNQSNDGSTTPQAYINYIFFDEQLNPIVNNMGMNRVDGQEGVVQVNEAKATYNGYVYVYLSNASGVPVYFDDFFVQHERGRLIQEDHYYAYGLGISALSSKAAGTLDNKYRFNAGTELNDEFDINLYETPHRGYDAQLGSFRQIDALAEKFLDWCPYQFGYDNPMRFNDPTGLEPLPGTFEELVSYIQSRGSRYGRNRFEEFGKVYPEDGAVEWAREQQANQNTEFWNSIASWISSLPAGVNYHFSLDETVTSMKSTTYFYYDADEGVGTFFTSSFRGEQAIADGKDYHYTHMAVHVVVPYLRLNSPPNNVECPNCLNPSTIGQNLLGLTYPGGDNPPVGRSVPQGHCDL